MATDPTQRIERRRIASPFAMGAEDLLERISALQPSVDAPYLTVTVDWRPEGTSPGRAVPEEVKRSRRRAGVELEGDRWRPAIEILENQIEDLIEQLGERGEAHDSLHEGYEKIMTYLQQDSDPAAQGVYVVANSALGVFEATGLSLPVETEIKVGPVPAAYRLVQMVEDNPIYAVLLADQQDATLTFFAYGGANRQVTLEGTDYPRHQQQGGWSQRRYQARADERMEAFARDVAEETRKQLDRLGVDTLILAGNETFLPILRDAFHESIQERIVDTLHLDLTTSDSELMEATLPVVERVEQDRELEVVQRLRDAIGMNARGAGGPTDTIRALQNGQVDTLVMTDTFEGRGWADYDMHLFGAGNHPTQHPAGGDAAAIVDVDLREEMVRLALMTGAEVEIIHSGVPVQESSEVPDAEDERPTTEAAAALKEFGGVGVLLRYDLDETAPEQTI